MLTGQGIDTDYQIQLVENYQQRAERLGYGSRNPLFKTVIETLEPAGEGQAKFWPSNPWITPRWCFAICIEKSTAYTSGL